MNKNNNFVIAFSGASHSGKTTLMQNIKKTLGDNCIIVDECVRRVLLNESIDSIRKDADKYLEFQIKIIKQKIEEEKEAIKNNNSKLILVDRSRIDSLLYFVSYVDKNHLSEKSKEKYEKFYSYLMEEIESNFSKVYDKVVFMTPIKYEKDESDKFRTSSLNHFQQMESDFIFYFTKNMISDDRMIILNKSKEFNFYEFYHDLVKNVFPKAIQVYSDYKEKLENENYTLDNIIMNSFEKAIEIKPTDFPHWDLYYLTGCLYASNKDDVKFSGEVISRVKQIKVKDEYKDSLCYPSGFIEKNGTMIIGEAPGIKGRGLNSNFLKPAFYFTQTSWLLRRSLYACEKVAYITNAIKYAVPGNDAKEEDFEACFDILSFEIDYLKPKQIYVLGKKTFDFLSECLPGKYLKIAKYVMHPAGALYKNISPIVYAENFAD